MEYLKKSFNFLAKHILVIIPLYIAVVIPLFFTGMAMNALMTKIPEMIQSIMSEGSMSDPMEIFQYFASTMQTTMGGSAIGGLLGLVLSLIAYPIVVGLIKKGLAGEETGFEHFLDALKENFVQYLLFIIGCIIVGVIVGVGLTIVFLIIGLILGMLGEVGAVLMILIGLAALVFGVYFGVRVFALWLPAMIIDKAGIFEGLKKGFAATKGSFWLLFLVSLLIMIISAVLSLILSFLGGIVIIGPIVLGAVSTLASFLLLIFYMIVYKEKSQGGTTEPATDAGTE